MATFTIELPAAAGDEEIYDLVFTSDAIDNLNEFTTEMRLRGCVVGTFHRKGDRYRGPDFEAALFPTGLIVLPGDSGR